MKDNKPPDDLSRKELRGMGQTTAALKRIVFYLLIYLVACTLPNGQIKSSPTSFPTAEILQTPIATPSPPPTATLPVTATSFVVLVAQKLVWFAPLPQLPESDNRPYTGSDDFLDLFTPDSPWKAASQRVNVFKLYGEWVAYYASDKELVSVVTGLSNRKISLAVEVGPLTPSNQCGEGVEGFAGLGEGLLIGRRIKQAGGTINYLALDEPYYYGHIYKGKNACNWNDEQIAKEISDYAQGMRSVFPEVQVGDIEPLPEDVLPEEYMLWLDDYRQLEGSDLTFFHLDMDFQRARWPQAALDLEEYCHSRGIDFGIIYDGNSSPVEPNLDVGMTQNQEGEIWLNTAWERAGLYESFAGGRPDHVIFQSWEDQPDRVLPEDDPSSFTYLINRYFRARSTIQAQIIAPETADNIFVNGTLTRETGEAIPNAPLEASLSLSYIPTVLPTLVITQVEGTTQVDGGFSFSFSNLPKFGSEFLLHSIGSEPIPPTGDTGYWPAYLTIAAGNPGQNIAFGKKAVASVKYEGSDPAFVNDGNPGSVWTAGAGPRNFVEIELEKPTAVSLVRLMVSQYPAGKTIHWLWGKDSQGVFHLLKEISGITADRDIINVWPPSPWEDLVSIRIETVQSPSWVAWREIEIITP